MFQLKFSSRLTRHLIAQSSYGSATDTRRSDDGNAVCNGFKLQKEDYIGAGTMHPEIHFPVTSFYSFSALRSSLARSQDGDGTGLHRDLDFYTSILIPKVAFKKRFDVM